MVETAHNDEAPAETATTVAPPSPPENGDKSRIAKAIEDARTTLGASASVIGEEALGKASQLKDKVRDNLTATAGEWSEQAGVYAEQARQKGLELAQLGKSRTSDALGALGRVISQTAPSIDEKLGVAYGDHARNAARSVHETAASLESKDFEELGEEVKQWVRQRPVAAIGIAAAVGFVLSRLLRGSGSRPDKPEA